MLEAVLRATRRWVVAAVLIVAVPGILLGAPAAAQATLADEIIEDVAVVLDFDGYYVAPDAVDEIDRFEALADRAGDTGNNWYFVSLGSEPEFGPSVYAGQVYDLLPDSGTVVVINEYDAGGGETRFEAGVVSADYTDAQITAGENLAANRLAGGSGTAADIAEALFDGIDAQEIDSGGGVSAAWLLVPVGVVGAGVVGSRMLGKRKKEQQLDEDIRTAKSEIKDQLDAVANHVISQADYVELSDNEQAKQYYAEATETYTQVEGELERTEDLLELATLNHRIDIARWQMESAEALIEGREPPPKPTDENPVACFFDPTHKPGTEMATITTAAGEKDVRVCKEDAEKLERGERPQPRMINVGGQRVPAAKAPRSHGGLGMGGIDVFDILVGGSTRGRRRVEPRSFPWDWQTGSTYGRTRTRPTAAPSRTRTTSRTPTTSRRPGGGVFGPDPLPRSSRSNRRSTSSSRPTPRRATRRSRSTSGKRAAKGRSRRRF